jgi:hypothetical protein
MEFLNIIGLSESSDINHVSHPVKMIAERIDSEKSNLSLPLISHLAEKKPVSSG